MAARWSESGEFVVARDCQSLADQGLQTRADFESRFAQAAARAWVGEHERALSARISVTGMLGQVVSWVQGWRGAGGAGLRAGPGSPAV